MQTAMMPGRTSLSGAFINFIILLLIGSVFGVAAFTSIAIVPVLVGLLIGGVVLLTRPMLACYVLIVVIALTSAMPRGSIIPMLAPNELMLLATVAIVGLQILVRRKEKPLAGAILFGSAILIFSTVIVPILAFSIMGHSFSVITIFKMAAPIQYLLIFWAFSNMPRTDKERRSILQFMFLCASIVSLIGLLQAANVPFVTSFLSEWYPSAHTEKANSFGSGRITSVFAAWNVLGTFLMMNLLLLLAYNDDDEVPRHYKINMAISAILSLAALLGSGSYASVVGLLVGVFIVKIFDPRGMKQLVSMFFIAIIAGFILSPLMAERFAYQFERSESGWIPQTLEFRIEVWRDIYIPLVLDHPVWGVAPSMSNLSWEHPESQYIMLAFQSGFIGVIGFFTWLGSLLLWLLTIIQGKLNNMRAVAISVFAVLVVLTIMGVTNPVFTYSGVIDYMWILLGLIASKQKDKLHVAY